MIIPVALDLTETQQWCSVAEMDHDSISAGLHWSASLGVRSSTEFLLHEASPVDILQEHTWWDTGSGQNSSKANLEMHTMWLLGPQAVSLLLYKFASIGTQGLQAIFSLLCLFLLSATPFLSFQIAYGPGICIVWEKLTSKTKMKTGLLGIFYLPPVPRLHQPWDTLFQLDGCFHDLFISFQICVFY